MMFLKENPGYMSIYLGGQDGVLWMLMSLLAMCCNDEEREKIEYVYLHYERTVFYVIDQQVNNPSVSEDLAHDLFVKLIRISDQVDVSDEHQLKSFLTVMAKNIVIDYQRKKKKYRIADTESDEIFDSLPEQSEASPLDIVIRREDYHKLLACIEKLGEKNKSIFRLKYILEYSNAEIAKLLNMSSTKEVSAKLYREKKMLMKMMGGNPNGENGQEQRDTF